MRPWKKRLLFGLAVVGLLVLGVAWFLYNFEYTEYTDEVGASVEARRNPLLAAERFYEAMGLEAESRAFLAEPPGTDRVLLYYGSGRTLSRDRVAELRRWVADGGHLVVALRPALPFRSPDGAADEDEDEDDDEHEHEESDDVFERDELEIDVDDPAVGTELLRAFGVEVFEPEEVDEPEDDGVALLEGDDPLDVRLRGPLRLDDTERLAHHTTGPPHAARFLELEVGDGLLSVLCSGGWLTNDELGDRQHADFAWELVGRGVGRTGAVLVFGDRSPGLFELLWRHAWMAVASLLAYIALWLWARGRRFGPVLPELPLDRRDFSEHVAATGTFLWRHRASSSLLDAVRRGFERRLELARPSWAAAEPEEKAALLAEASGLEVERVRAALETPETLDPAEFTRIVADLERTRNAL